MRSSVPDPNLGRVVDGILKPSPARENQSTEPTQSHQHMTAPVAAASVLSATKPVTQIPIGSYLGQAFLGLNKDKIAQQGGGPPSSSSSSDLSDSSSSSSSSELSSSSDSGSSLTSDSESSSSDNSIWRKQKHSKKKIHKKKKTHHVEH